MLTQGRVLLCAGWLAGFPALAAAGGSAPVARTRVRGGGTPVVALPVLPLSQPLPRQLEAGLPSLNGLIPLPSGVPNPALITSAPGILGFRAESPVPMLPRSVITAIQPAAAHEAAAFLEAIGPEMAAQPWLKPGPGDDLPPMQRQAALMDAKQVAVSRELKAASDAPDASAEASGALGQRLIDLLMGRSGVSSREGHLVPDAPSIPHGFGPALSAGRSLFLRGKVPADGGLSAAAGAAETQQSLRPDETAGLAPSLIGADPASFGSSVESPHAAPPISLIILQVYRQALLLSYLTAPGQAPVARFSGSTAGRVSRSWLGSPSGPSAYARRSAPTTLSHTAASGYSQSSAPGSLTGTAVTAASAGGEEFLFLQEAGERLAAQTDPVLSPASVPSSWTTAAKGQPSLPSSAPFLVVSFLPILGIGLLALTSRP